MEIALAQLKAVPGDLERNAHAIVRAVDDAARAGAALVVTSARALTGFVSADKGADATFTAVVDRAVADLAARLRGPAVALGAVEAAAGTLRDAVLLLREGAVIACRQPPLPSLLVHEIGDTRFAFAVADDALADAAAGARRAGAQAFVALAASPYRVGVHERRRALAATAAAHATLPVYLVNAVGADATAVLDGASFVIDGAGALVQQVPAWHATVAIARLTSGVPVPVRGRLDPECAAHVYEALVLVVREAAARVDARDVIVEADDPLDGALALAVARDALGGGNAMLAKPRARRAIGGDAGVLDVGSAVQDTGRRNPSRTLRIEACNRSTLVLRAAGETVADGSRFNALGDLSRTLERAVARYRNSIGRVMPESILDDVSSVARAPAEVPSVPAEEADAITAAVLEEGTPRDDLVASGHSPVAVDAVLRALRAGALQPLVRITARPGDAVLAQPAH